MRLGTAPSARHVNSSEQKLYQSPLPGTLQVLIDFHGKAGVELLRAGAPKDLLRMWPVSKRVNVSRRGDDDQGLIKPTEALATG